MIILEWRLLDSGRDLLWNGKRASYWTVSEEVVVIVQMIHASKLSRQLFEPQNYAARIHVACCKMFNKCFISCFFKQS